MTAHRQQGTMRRTLYFDRQDRELLSIIDHALDAGHGQSERERQTFNALLHPHGIIELATSHAQRMALSVVNLLGSLEAGQVEDRLMALRRLRDEVLNSAQTTFRLNTGRVLIQMMKEIVRLRGDETRRLMLAHDFRQVATGNPRLVRKFLNEYLLLEMPEAWNQIAMDHHVHDSNTKGRKNPTHLIMDAWVKGLRTLSIIYYNFMTPEAMSELYRAADIMGITLSVGLEYRVPFRDDGISIVWEPLGLTDKNTALAFLNSRAVEQIMHEGRKASDWATLHVLKALESWNSSQRLTINRELGIQVAPLDRQRFLDFVGSGQASFLHLAEMVHRWVQPSLKLKYQELERKAGELSAPRKDGEDRDSTTSLTEEERALRIKGLRQEMQYLNTLTPEVVLHSWLGEHGKAQLPFPTGRTPLALESETPEILTVSPIALLERLSALHPNSNFWLNLSDLSPEDVMELLWDCKGKLTHLEIFNLKEWQEGRTPHLREISRIQQAINEGTPLHLKHIAHTMLRENECNGSDTERCAKLREILLNIRTLQTPYLAKPLRSRFGTDSTSNSSLRHGMGLVLPQTLPAHVQRRLRREKYAMRLKAPVHVTAVERVSYVAPQQRYISMFDQFAAWIRRVTGWTRPGMRKQWEWVVNSDTARIEDEGNIITTGGIGTFDNGFAKAGGDAHKTFRPGLRYLNTTSLNTLKVVTGFAAAMLTFLYTQDWWVLMWLGAVIWFAITALRNIVQAVLSGRGVIRSSFLRWSHYVNTTRVCDSLMYTGFSVPLLELGVRVLLLERLFDITVRTSPFVVFAIMSLANGLYIAGHNIYRGFPKEAVIGNMFRSVLAIPVSILYYDVLLMLLPALGVAAPVPYLERGAAVVSKFASDTVAGLIEGFADRRNNLRLRYMDYITKLTQLFDTYTRMETTYPESDILRLLARPKNLLRFTEEKGKTLQVAAIINALDLMYIWLYQPQAQQAMARGIRYMSRDERIIFSRSQLVLTRVREVSQLFVNGLVGDHFARALAFYLDRHEEYIEAMHALSFQDDLDALDEVDDGESTIQGAHSPLENIEPEEPDDHTPLSGLEHSAENRSVLNICFAGESVRGEFAKEERAKDEHAKKESTNDESTG